LRPAAAAGIVAAMHEGSLDGLERFLGLSLWEVEHEAASARGPVAFARTWYSLANLMRRKDYGLVRELGVPAATSWAEHLGVISRSR
jgi:hypothetical protein